jgi:hypothetical protein
LIVESGIKAKKIKNLIKGSDFMQISPDELNSFIEDFNVTLEQLKAENSKPMAGTYTRACDEFMKAAKEMMRRIRDKKPFTDFEKRQIAMGFRGDDRRLARKIDERVQLDDSAAAFYAVLNLERTTSLENPKIADRPHFFRLIASTFTWRLLIVRTRGFSRTSSKKFLYGFGLNGLAGISRRASNTPPGSQGCSHKRFTLESLNIPARSN